MEARFARISVIALAALVAGGCGSGSTARTSAARPHSKLSLVKSGGSSAKGAADAVAPGPFSLRPTSYVLDGKLPDLGSQAVVYRWTAHSTTVDDVNKIADALGIKATATTTGDGFQATDGNATLNVTVSGGATQVSYFLGGPAAIGGSSPGSTGSGSGSSGASTGSANQSTGDGTPPVDKPVPGGPGPTATLPERLTAPVDVPDAHDAETIARDLLDHAGVLTGQQWDAEVNDSGGIAVSCVVGQECTGIPDQVSARDVTFHLMIGGARVDGVDWTVTVGEHSKVESVFGEWGSAVVLGTYDLRSTTDAFTALQHDDANFGGVEPVAGGDVPVKAQDAPAKSATAQSAPPETGPVATAPVETVPIGTAPTDTTPPDTSPIVVHITGVSLGVARWDAVDGDQNVVDLVPTYLFHTSGADNSSSDLQVLALDPAAITFAHPITPPVPEPGPPGTIGTKPEPAPAPHPPSSEVTKPAPPS